MKENEKIIFFEAVATMVGAIIGAGILGIPFVFARAGFWTGTLVLFIVGLAMCFMKLLYGEMTLRTEGDHQIVGYTEKYLGKTLRNVVSFILILSINGSLLAYFIGQGQVIEAITGIPSFWASIGFFAVFSGFVYAGINLVKHIEFFMSLAIFFVIVLIAVLSRVHIEPTNLTGFDFKNLLIPYGVLIFACSGIVSIPEVRQILVGREKLMKKTIIWGCSIPPIVYFIFTALVVSVSGKSVTEVASVGLGDLIGWRMIIIANVFAFVTMATSFMASGVALKQIYQFDYKIPRFLSWSMVIVFPLFVFLLGVRDFQQVISFVGALGIGVAGTIEIITYFVARKKGEREPEYVIPAWLGTVGGGVLVVLFIGGAILSLFPHLIN